MYEHCLGIQLTGMRANVPTAFVKCRRFKRFASTPVALSASRSGPGDSEEVVPFSWTLPPPPPLIPFMPLCPVKGQAMFFFESLTEYYVGR